MKNLKKVLSLVLALAMALSLMTVAFATDAGDFADYDDVTYNEAVDVMTAIGVFDGTTGNNFDPNGTLTREQAAKIITYMLMGKTDADKLTTVIAPYSDVPANRWSAGSIAYCTNKGIIAGVGGGKFEPTRQVTGLEFAKMLLCALDYDASVEGLEGGAWAINTASLAVAAGLADDLDAVVLSGPISREEAAQMAFNAEKAVMVYYSQKTEVSTGGDTTVTISGGRFDKTNTSTTEGNIAADGYMNFAEKYCTKLKVTGDTTNFNAPATTWSYDGEDVGTYGKDAKLTYTAEVKFKALKKALPSNVVNNIKSLNYYVDGVSNGTITASNLVAGADTAISTTGNGVLTEVYYSYNDNAPAGYDVVITSINTYATKVVESEVNEDGKYDVDTTSSYSFEAVAPFAEDTIVLYTWSGKTGDVESMVAAESVTGDTTAVKTDNGGTTGKTFTMNGKTYSYSAQFDVNDAGDVAKLTANASDVVAYVDAYGYVIRIDNATSDTNYAVVVAYETAWSGNRTTNTVELLLADGTVASVSMKNKLADGTSIVWGTTLKNNDVITYTVNSSNVYTATKLGSVSAAATDPAEVNQGVSKFDVDGNTYYATDETVFFLYDGSDYSAYVGIDKVPSLKTTNKLTNYYVEATSTVAEAVYMITSANIETGTSGDLAAFIYKTGSEYYYDVKDVDTYYTVKAVVNGEATTLDVNSSYYGSLSSGANLVNKVSIDKNNLVTNTSAVAAENQVSGTAYTAAKNGIVVIGTTGYKYTSDAVAYVYDTGDDAFTKKTVAALKGFTTGNSVVAQLKDNVIVAIYYVQP